MSKESLHTAYVLHSRPYRDTSLLVDFFTHEEGKVTAVARGVRGKSSALKSLLQPFAPLLISWGGKGDLVTLFKTEADGPRFRLSGANLLSGIYLNELLIRLLQHRDAHPQLFWTYAQTLKELQDCSQQEATLRKFEFELLKELGFALQLDCIKNSAEAIDVNTYYRFHPNEGLIPETNIEYEQQRSQLFYGEHLLAMQQQKFDNIQILKDAKRLIRIALSPLLSNRPIMSRELFIRSPMYVTE